MLDYHIHPDYSVDAEGTIFEYCEAALEKGLQEICFTTHLDSDSTAEDCFVRVSGKKVNVKNDYWLEHYESSVRSAHDRFSEEGLNVRLGVELDYYPGVTENLPEKFFRIDFDCVIGSIHLIDHKAISTADSVETVYSKMTLDEIGQIYYTHLIEAASCDFIDVLGHIDLYRRYGEKHYGPEIHDLWKPYISDLAEVMLTNNTGFEVNTSSWRKGLSEPMPEEALIRALREKGVKTVTLGSDAHSPSILGYEINRAHEIIIRCGFEAPSIFESGKPIKFHVPRESWTE